MNNFQTNREKKLEFRKTNKISTNPQKAKDKWKKNRKYESNRREEVKWFKKKKPNYISNHSKCNQRGYIGFKSRQPSARFTQLKMRVSDEMKNKIQLYTVYKWYTKIIPKDIKQWKRKAWEKENYLSLCKY